MCSATFVTGFSTVNCHSQISFYIYSYTGSRFCCDPQTTNLCTGCPHAGWRTFSPSTNPWCVLEVAWTFQQTAAYMPGGKQTPNSGCLCFTTVCSTDSSSSPGCSNCAHVFSSDTRCLDIFQLHGLTPAARGLAKPTLPLCLQV